MCVWASIIKTNHCKVILHPSSPFLHPSHSVPNLFTYTHITQHTHTHILWFANTCADLQFLSLFLPRLGWWSFVVVVPRNRRVVLIPLLLLHSLTFFIFLYLCQSLSATSNYSPWVRHQLRICTKHAHTLYL